jgi:CHAT domain-containing protein
VQDGAAPLTVADLNALRLDAKLAYLAACDSTFTHQLLADEAVHITAAFHLAGFRQVIGTLWPVSDLFAAGISAAVYGRMTGAGSRAPDVSLAGFIHVGGAQLG